jgi:hypothetical protein
VAATTTPADSRGLTFATGIIDFLGNLLKIPTVSRVSYARSGATLHIWVLFAYDDEEGMKEAVMAEREMRRGPDSEAIDVHFFALDEIHPDLLPPATVFLQR